MSGPPPQAGVPTTLAHETPNAVGLYSSSQAISGRAYRLLQPSSEHRASRPSFVSATGHLAWMRCVHCWKCPIQGANRSRPAGIDGDDLRQEVAHWNGRIVTEAGIAARHRCSAGAFDEAVRHETC